MKCEFVVRFFYAEKLGEGALNSVWGQILPCEVLNSVPVSVGKT